MSICRDPVVWWIYWRIVAFEYDGGECFESPKEMMKRLNIPWSSFGRSVQRGVEAELFSRSGKPHWRSTWRITTVIEGFDGDNHPIISKKTAKEENALKVSVSGSLERVGSTHPDQGDPNGPTHPELGGTHPDQGVHHRWVELNSGDSKVEVVEGTATAGILKCVKEEKEGARPGMPEARSQGRSSTRPSLDSLPVSPNGRISGSPTGFPTGFPTDLPTGPSVGSSVGPSAGSSTVSSARPSSCSHGPLGSLTGPSKGMAAVAGDPLAEKALRAYRRVANRVANEKNVEAGRRARPMLFPSDERDLDEMRTLGQSIGPSLVEIVEASTSGWARKQLERDPLVAPKQLLRTSYLCKWLMGRFNQGLMSDCKTLEPEDPAVAAAAANRDRIGESMEKLFAEGIVAKTVFFACQCWGVVLTAHFISSKMGPMKAIECVTDSLSGQALHEVRGCLSITAKFDKFTSGMAFSDWRTRLADLLVNVGKLDEFHLDDDDRSRVQKFTEGLAKVKVAVAAMGEAETDKMNKEAV